VDLASGTLDIVTRSVSIYCILVTTYSIISVCQSDCVCACCYDV